MFRSLATAGSPGAAGVELDILGLRQVKAPRHRQVGELFDPLKGLEGYPWLSRITD